MRLKLIIISLALFLHSCFGGDEKLPRVENTTFGYDILHLTKEDTKLFPQLKKDEIEVHYYFAWGCPHCYEFHPYLLKWIQNDDNFKKITFNKTPVSLLANWVDLSRLYYVAKDKEFLQELDLPLFNALHKKNTPLSDWIEDIAKFATPFAQKIDTTLTTDKIIDLMESDDVSSRILQDNERILTLMLQTTPVIIVRFNDSFYKINNKSSSKNKGIIHTLNQLINTLEK